MDGHRSVDPFYQELHLPMSLHQMGIFPEDAQVIDQLVQFIDSKEKYT